MTERHRRRRLKPGAGGTPVAWSECALLAVACGVCAASPRQRPAGRSVRPAQPAHRADASARRRPIPRTARRHPHRARAEPSPRRQRSGARRAGRASRSSRARRSCSTPGSSSTPSSSRSRRWSRARRAPRPSTRALIISAVNQQLGIPEDAAADAAVRSQPPADARSVDHAADRSETRQLAVRPTTSRRRAAEAATSAGCRDGARRALRRPRSARRSARSSRATTPAARRGAARASQPALAGGARSRRRSPTSCSWTTAQVRTDRLRHRVGRRDRRPVRRHRPELDGTTARAGPASARRIGSTVGGARRLRARARQQADPRRRRADRHVRRHRRGRRPHDRHADAAGADRGVLAQRGARRRRRRRSSAASPRRRPTPRRAGCCASPGLAAAGGALPFLLYAGDPRQASTARRAASPACCRPAAWSPARGSASG